MPKGYVASPGDLNDAGFTKGGISKGSLGSGMMSYADKNAGSRGVVPPLQSAGARGQPFSAGNVSRGALDQSGFSSGGIQRNSGGANAMSAAYTSGAGKGVVSAAQSAGARK
nr:uncharacterized protein LOC123765463 [Procambarus clarkii]